MAYGYYVFVCYHDSLNVLMERPAGKGEGQSEVKLSSQ